MAHDSATGLITRKPRVRAVRRTDTKAGSVGRPLPCPPTLTAQSFGRWPHLHQHLPPADTLSGAVYNRGCGDGGSPLARLETCRDKFGMQPLTRANRPGHCSSHSMNSDQLNSTV